MQKEDKEETQKFLIKVRKEKIKKEIKSAKKIVKSEIEPLTIADRFFHSMVLLLKNGILTRFPDLDNEALKKMIKKNLNISLQIKTFKLK
jgi:hypothetical protein